MEAVRNERKYARSAITRVVNKVRSEVGNYDVSQLELYKTKLTEMLANQKILDSKVFQGLVAANSEEALLQAEYDSREQYSDNLLAALYLVQNKLASLQSTPVLAQNNATGPAVYVPQHARNIRLPEIPMPTYANKEGENLHDFFTNLDNILGDYPNLTEFQKLSFLKRQLLGEPLSLVNGLSVERQKYGIAKDLLTRAFASKIAQQYDAIKRLADLKYTPKLPYEYVGKLDQIKESFKSLDISVDIVLQYFFWYSMPEGLQNQFVNMANKNRPSLDDLDLHLFDAIERYTDLSKRKHAAPKHESVADVSNLAISMNKFKPKADEKQQFCSFCSSPGGKVTTHSSYSCTLYPSVEQKLQKIRDSGGCERCANMTHSTPQCKFKFKNRCIHCKKFHFGYLCPTKGPPAKNPQNGTVNAYCVWVAESTLDKSGQDSVMPTFTCDINGTCVRVLKDSGAQSCFIEQELADKLGLTVIQDDLNMNVHGFNSSNKRILFAEIQFCRK